MSVQFVLGRNPNGTFRHVQFEVYVDSYDVPDFEFSMRSSDNIAMILKQYAEIDRLNRISYIGVTWLQFKKSNVCFNVRFDIVVTLYPKNNVVNWKISLDHKRPLPLVLQWLYHRMDPIFIGIKNIIVGTTQSLLIDMKEDRRVQVQQKAARRAMIMRSNAETILEFLPIPIDAVETIRNTPDMDHHRAEAAANILVQTSGEFPGEIS